MLLIPFEIIKSNGILYMWTGVEWVRYFPQFYRTYYS